ncbi:SHOCT domain-containing protein [Intrasporangium sp.]|jgi:predicted ferric reductase|uniref:SHOCT domain-containing protein n=1 Tax=Intrasporangium sp. TaxID=1925024 RepID=UPI003365750E
MSFWDIVWFIVIFFAFMAYLMVLFMILGDLMSDNETSGWAKGAWVVFLVILPLIASLIYLIARGSGMSRRRMAEVKTVQKMQEDYIRDVAGQPTAAGAADQVAKAKDLLDSGTITRDEFDALKAKALA